MYRNHTGNIKHISTHIKTRQWPEICQAYINGMAIIRAIVLCAITDNCPLLHKGGHMNQSAYM